MREGLKTARLLMVLSSISPLFVLWAIHGSILVPDRWFIAFCTLMVLIPNGFLWLRVRAAKKVEPVHERLVGRVDDHRNHVLIYLFAMLLPFYATELGTWREFAAALTAIAFIVFLFWHLNLHYLNIVFAVLGYRVFMIYPKHDENTLSGTSGWVLITRRDHLPEDIKITAHRISDTVYLEASV